ncbi:MAG: FKBP-type peptidyl-prolyl cis-trans isomerase [Candidatus Paceibacterota bacterium]
MTTMQVTSTGVAVALAVVIALGLLFFGPRVFAPFSPISQTATSTQATSTDTLSISTTTTVTTMTTSASIPSPLPTTLTATDEVIGTGAVATAGHNVTVNYVGMLPDGTVFDASARHPETQAGFSFPLGGGRVIKGWDEGVVGMKVGGKRRLIIPAAYGYGAQGVPGVIPANATLIFDVELLGVQ